MQSVDISRQDDCGPFSTEHCGIVTWSKTINTGLILHLGLQTGAVEVFRVAALTRVYMWSGVSPTETLSIVWVCTFGMKKKQQLFRRSVKVDVVIWAHIKGVSCDTICWYSQVAKQSLLPIGKPQSHLSHSIIHPISLLCSSNSWSREMKSSSPSPAPVWPREMIGWSHFVSSANWLFPVTQVNSSTTH